MFDAQDDRGAAELHPEGGKAASSEQVWIEADERSGELRGNQWAKYAARRDPREVLP